MNKIEAKNLGRLKRIKNQFGLTAREIAKLTHKQPGSVRKYLCGIDPVQDDFLELLEYKVGIRKAV